MRLCCFCEHMLFDYEEASGCATCGWGADEGRTYMVCQKGHWEVGLTWGLTFYREKIRTAETCPDFQLADM
jgi:hypothetical protein